MRIKIFFLLPIVVCQVILLPFFAFGQAGAAEIEETISAVNFEQYYTSYLAMLPAALSGKDFTAIDRLYLKLKTIRQVSYEPLFRAKLLTALESRSFNLSSFSRKEVFLLLEYKEESEKVDLKVGTDSLKSKQAELIQAYNRITIAYAQKLLQTYPPGSAQYLLCLFYANNFDQFFALLWKGREEDSPLHRAFWEFRRENEGLANNLSIMWFTGAWQPLGNNIVLGTQPVLGLTLAKEFLFIEGAITVLAGGLIPTKEYTVSVREELITRTMFFRVYFAGEVSFLVFAPGQHEIRILTGIGGDGNMDFQSFNLNAGLGYRYFFQIPKQWFLYSELRFDFIDYMNDEGTNLRGPALSLRLGVGLHFDNPVLRQINAAP